MWRLLTFWALFIYKRLSKLYIFLLHIPYLDVPGVSSIAEKRAKVDSSDEKQDGSGKDPGGKWLRSGQLPPHEFFGGR